MTPNEYLNRVKQGRLEYQRLLRKIAELEAIAEKVTPILSDMPKSPAEYGQTDQPWATLADYRTICVEKIKQFTEDSMTLEAELAVIRNANIKIAMAYRYIDAMTYEQIADRMHYTDRYIRRLLKEGRKIYFSAYANKADNEKRGEDI